MIVIASTVPKIEKWLIDAFTQYAPENSFCVLGDSRAESATTAVCWFPDLDALEKLPNLKLIHSMAAGVEHLNLQRIAERYLVSRVVDEHHQKGMFDYLHWGILYYQRYFDQVIAQQKQQRWRQYPQRASTDLKIGIMGLGHMGGFIAQQFAALGYQVFGWSRNIKELAGVETFAGDAVRDAFLSQAEILINLLPLTDDNRGILSQDLFLQLPQNACVINCGRGQHLVEQDLINALDTQHLRGAILDVFSKEPLAQGHPFWQHEKVLVTPHIASHAPWSTVVAQIFENDRRVLSGGGIIQSG